MVKFRLKHEPLFKAKLDYNPDQSNGDGEAGIQ
jgi:hypothetical protein